MMFLHTLVLLLASVAQQPQADQRPNILWITSEDNGPHLGCYGFEQARTPNLDALAARGMRFDHVWSNAPVCAPARTTIITGVYAPHLGAQHMRSRVPLPDGYVMFPQLLRQAGYYCSNNAKTDYNLIGYGQVWDQSNRRAHWRGRRPGQPFFAVFNFTTTHESQTRKQPHQAIQDPKTVELPGYLPDLPEVRKGWAQYYDQIAVMDGQVGKVLQQLEQDGLADQTIVFYYADHGAGFARAKRWPGNSGLHVPMLAYFPPRYRHLAPPGYEQGSVSKEMVGFVDLAPTVLSLAGANIPGYMHGRAIAGEQRGEDPGYLYGFRDRMDERIDMCRSVRDEHLVYIRNYLSRLPHGQHLDYLFQTPATQAWWRAYQGGDLPVRHRRYWQPRQIEELYDLRNDPAELVNLIADPAYADDLKRLRLVNREHLLRIEDLGFVPEAELHRLVSGQSPRRLFAANSSEQMQAWMEAAEQAANPVATEDPIRQFWALQSWLTNKPFVSAKQMEGVAELMAAESLSVAIAAAEYLATHFADLPQAAAARARLIEIADPNYESLYAAVAAWNAIQRVKSWSSQELKLIRALPTAADGYPRPLQSYLPRLLEHFEQTHSESKENGNDED